MAKVILTRNMFCGYRIRKSPNKYTPVEVPDQYLKFLPPGSRIVEQGEEVEKPKEQPRQTLKDFDEDRVMHEQVEHRLKEVSVSEITSDAQELIEKYALNLDDISGTGKNGRITKVDVLNYIDGAQ